MKEFDQIKLVLYGRLGLTDKPTLALTFLPVPTKAKYTLPLEEIRVGFIALRISSSQFCEKREFQGDVSYWRKEDCHEQKQAVVETTNIAQPIQRAVIPALNRDHTLAELGEETHDLVMKIWVFKCRPFVIVTFLWGTERYILEVYFVELPVLYP